MSDVMTDAMTVQISAYVWAEEYDDKLCSVEVASLNEKGGANLSVYVDGERDPAIQIECGRENALALAEAFLKAALHG